ncbi:MAG: NAD(P)/FAD-dependent oxidoreductase [Eubacteriales bacterium]
MTYDAVIVGGGIAGLTAAAYLSKSGYKVIICEKEKKIGGLVNSFVYKGFTFDGGIRAFENSGIIMPMIRQLGLDIDLVKNNVSIGIEKEVVNLVSADSLHDYQALLNSQFPENADDIQKIIDDIKKVMGYMDILYGIDNPLFLDFKKDRDYLIKTILPWMFKYLITIRKIQKLSMPIDEYLQKLTGNQVLIDMIAQHFFQKTPSSFALSYFSLYLDYLYPKGGTGSLTGKLEQFILEHKGEISTETLICSVSPHTHMITDTLGRQFSYKKLIWASDLKKLYRMTDIDSIPDKKIRQRIAAQNNAVADKIGGDSILTLYLTADIDKSYFEGICNPHFFYTPLKKGLLNIDLNSLKDKSDGTGRFSADQAVITEWLQKFYQLTTYEISFPVMRDPDLAPEGKTGIIISALFEYSLAEHISKSGWYDAFKEISAERIITILESTIFPGLKGMVIDHLVSTPLTLEKIAGNSEGAITGWAFTNSSIPVVSSMPQIARSVLTPIPDVLQAGQWTFSPSGLPISILTGKLAADKVKKQIKLQP